MEVYETASSRAVWRQLAKERDAQKTFGEWAQFQGTTPAFDLPLSAVSGSCANSTNRLADLTREDAQLHRIDWWGVCFDLARAAELAGEVMPVDGHPFLWRMGFRVESARRHACFFAVPHGEQEARMLVKLMTAYRALLLMVPDADMAVSTVFAELSFLLHVLSDHAEEAGNACRRLTHTVVIPATKAILRGRVSSDQPPPGSPAVSRPLYALQQEPGSWTLIFDGNEVRLRPEKGILFVAYLLKHPDQVPIHALDLAAKIPAIYRRQDGIGGIVDPRTGARAQLQSDSRLQERSLGVDDLAAVRRHWRKRQALAAVLDDPGSTEPEKAEAVQELEQVDEFLARHARPSKSGADHIVRAIRRSIVRFHDRLAVAVDETGKAQPVCRAFAEHLAKYLLAPSGRFSGRTGGRVPGGPAGHFTYEPPEGVVWSD